MVKLMEKIQANRRRKKRKVTLLLHENLVAEIEEMAELFDTKKSEFVEQLLEHALQQLRRELERTKQPKREE